MCIRDSFSTTSNRRDRESGLGLGLRLWRRRLWRRWLLRLLHLLAHELAIFFHLLGVERANLVDEAPVFSHDDFFEPVDGVAGGRNGDGIDVLEIGTIALSLIHISEPTRLLSISYA